MNFSYNTYRFLTTWLFSVLYPPFLAYKFLRNDIRLYQKFGEYRNLKPSSIWIHAVSVGEVGVAESIINAINILIPKVSITLSVSTQSGMKLAKKIEKEKLGLKVNCIYAPLDFIFSIRKALNAIKPDIMVFIETEIWPTWIFESKKKGIKIALVNGRISSRSIDKYLKIKPFISAVLKKIDVLSMISESDAKRMISLGVDYNKIIINGNAKYDGLSNYVNENIKNELLKKFNIDDNTKVFVAGSTHNEEETIILDVYDSIIKKIPDTILVLAPRHIDRCFEIRKLVREKGHLCQLKTELNKNIKRESNVIIVDTIGELKDIYSIASIVFCGGSLVPLGGQNILEASVWEKLVFYGPFMDDFFDAKELIESLGAGIQIKTSDDFKQKAIYYLENIDKTKYLGKKAKEALIANSGSALKHAAEIVNFLSPHSFKTMFL